MRIHRVLLGLQLVYCVANAHAQLLVLSLVGVQLSLLALVALPQLFHLFLLAVMLLTIWMCCSQGTSKTGEGLLLLEPQEFLDL